MRIKDRIFGTKTEGRFKTQTINQSQDFKNDILCAIDARLAAHGPVDADATHRTLHMASQQLVQAAAASASSSQTAAKCMQVCTDMQQKQLTTMISESSVEAATAVKTSMLDALDRSKAAAREYARDAAARAATEAATDAATKAAKEAADVIESAAESVAEVSNDFEEATKRTMAAMERDMQEAATQAVERAVRGMRDDVREALNDNLDEYKERLHETSDQNMDILRAEMKAVVTAQVDRGVDAIALRVEGLVVKMEQAAAGLAVAAKKALTAARDDDSRDNSPAFVKASFEPSLPRVGVIAEELMAEDERAEEIRRSREPDYIACAPKLPSILDDLPVVRAK